MASAAFLEPLSHIPPTFQYPVKLCSYTTLTVYILSLITGNVSQVDRIWTFMPVIYSLYYAFLPALPLAGRDVGGGNGGWFFLVPYRPEEVPRDFVKDLSPRALMMVGLQLVWMIRLSYNTWRRGLFNLHDEDYRWAVLRAKIPPWLFQVVNISFIAIIQNIILFLLAIPTHMALTQPHTSLTTSDILLGALALLTILTEFVSDNQQYSYQTFKKTGFLKKPGQEWPGARIQWTEEDKKRGFVTRGLWAWSRHPNFLCEQSFWVIMNLIPLLAPTPPKLSLSTTYLLTPCLVLCTLFLSSTLFSESISKSKYPREYGMYQQRVAMFVPVLTPVWGWLLEVVRGRERKVEVDEVLFGRGKGGKKVE
ncbi:hypothetical protein JAAARDRAFT_33769 [Jaapia argillacea MUCL 33604]|uniref:Steroid 5-alpha reductase C-terminal domain-containing protein n=1 Tax=Jaapia argillacea MUCL 33604 TaxID=933084 RepID=A0A067PWG9_9AGAM|nr:hypothetical protein JAAARDRAFT_33769 [Jaapia argillacea MUCL 33604]